MTQSNSASDAEFSAMQSVYNALKPLDDDARSRVVDYIVSRLEIVTRGAKRQTGASVEPEGEDDSSIQAEEEAAPKYGSLAELFDAAQPNSGPEKALVSGYWLQVCEGAETFDAHSAHRELKNLGQGLGNITSAIDSLKSQKPALALQLKKSGKSQQARKTYKITVAGMKAVENMING